MEKLILSICATDPTLLSKNVEFLSCPPNNFNGTIVEHIPHVFQVQSSSNAERKGTVSYSYSVVTYIIQT